MEIPFRISVSKDWLIAFFMLYSPFKSPLLKSNSSAIYYSVQKMRGFFKSELLIAAQAVPGGVLIVEGN